jgi:hypothetical protein
MVLADLLSFPFIIRDDNWKVTKTIPTHNVKEYRLILVVYQKDLIILIKVERTIEHLTSDQMLTETPLLNPLKILIN